MKRYENAPTQNFYQMDHYFCNMLKKIGKDSICAKHITELERDWEKLFN